MKIFDDFLDSNGLAIALALFIAGLWCLGMGFWGFA